MLEDKNKKFDKLIDQINKEELNINSLPKQEMYDLLKYSYEKSITPENIVVLTQEEYDNLYENNCSCVGDSDCLSHHCANQ